MSGINKIQNQFRIPNENKAEFVKKTTTPSFAKVFEKSMEKLNKSWETSQNKLPSILKKIPENYRPMLEAQMMISNCNYQMEYVTKIADAAQTSIKKLQQQN